jgi:hypothetical protein
VFVSVVGIEAQEWLAGFMGVIDADLPDRPEEVCQSPPEVFGQLIVSHEL